MMTTEQKFDCVFCKEIFDDKEALLIHFRKHGDPNFNPPTKNITNEKPADENESVSCDVCDEVFPTISKAITHKHKAHPYHDAKYFCPFCGKLFTMKHLYNKHIQSNHENDEASDTKDFHCDCCEVTFYVPSAMMYHNKFFHRQDTELPAVGQSKKVKTYNRDMLQIYYCSFCGEEYNNKVNLHKHMSDDHADENQSPVEILRCPLCEAIFYHLDAYEIHLMFHSTEDLYSEKSEMAEKVTEFSLETVAPITERVEEEATDQPVDGIDNFLQLVMGDTADNAPEKVKSKKHKKHKKSKKAAITLDEFLNMNKDVFGDGLDVQGIEEVPTQVVLKKAKPKRISVKGQSKIVNADLAKLQKHGITVKTKSGARPRVVNVKNNTENVQLNKANHTNNPNEILSKLLNEGNSQIKIVKKSIPQNDIKNADDDTFDNNTDINNKLSEDNQGEDTPSEKDDQTPEKANNTQADTEIISKDSTPLSRASNEVSIENNTQSTNNYENVNSEKNRPFIALPDGKISIPTDENSIKNLETCLPSSSTVISGKSLNEIKRNLLVDYELANSDEIPEIDMKTKDHTKNVNENDADNNIANKTLNALKHLSHLITVKPINQPNSPTSGGTTGDKVNNENESKDRIKEDHQNASVSQQLSTNEQKSSKNVKIINNQITIKPSKTSTEHSQSDFDSDGEFNDYDESNLSAEFEGMDEINSPNSNIKRVKLKIKTLPIGQSKQIIKNEYDKIESNEAEHEDEFQAEENSNKGATSSNIDILKRLTNVTAKSIPSAKNINKPTNIKITKPIINQVKESLPKDVSKTSPEIEIYNIDDSDSDGDHKLGNEQSNQNLEALRSLGKNITIKSNQQNINITEVKDKKIINRSIKSENMSSESHFKFSKHSPDIQKSINLQNKLKSLSGNITVKSRNSPNLTNKEQINFDEFDDEDDPNDSEPESSVGKVKISEVTEDDVSDSECPDSRTDAIIESPHASNSETEDNHIDTDEEFADLENEIKKSLLKKQDQPTTSKKPTCLENFKHLNNLTIKSLNTKKNDSEEESNIPLQKEASEDTHVLNKQIAIKQLKNNIPQNGQNMNKMNQSSTSMNQTVNKNVSTSSNQVNTVKTVKKFQSQTVIEEITTTVTKTIRTVNQSSNETVQSNIRPGPRPMIRPQKIINRPQGPIIRHTPPTVGTRIRNATPIRHATPSTVKPSNQLVPVRPVLNISRSPASNIAVRQIAPPKNSPQKPLTGKLKISPHALNQAAKRPSDETSGHFSGFKKPKESPSMSMDMGDSFDDTVQYASATHSQSNFSSVTKTVKGKGMVTATQVRSEVSSQQQQLSKLGNMSGLKISKMSSKQTMQVEEKNIISTAKKNTLDALEKLQKQGLLVKKPRIDEYNDKSQSESDDDPS